jgi:hypothetical protein
MVGCEIEKVCREGRFVSENAITPDDALEIVGNCAVQNDYCACIYGPKNKASELYFP